MNQYKISILSNNKKSLYKFLRFFFKSCKSYKFVDRHFQKNKKRKVITILKSPHVNKKAQEQFQYNTYSKNINFNLSQLFNIFYKIKKIKFNLFSDVTLKTKVLVNYNLTRQLRKKVFNFDNFKLNVLKKKIYKNSKILITKINNPKIDQLINNPITSYFQRKNLKNRTRLLTLLSNVVKNPNKVRPLLNMLFIGLIKKNDKNNKRLPTKARYNVKDINLIKNLSVFFKTSDIFGELLYK
jgi:ribosomal protein S10